MKNIVETLGVSRDGWVAAEPAPSDQIEGLLRTYPDLPTDYISLLRVSNGGEGELNLPPQWLQLYDAKFVADLASGEIVKWHPGFIFFASNGGLETIAFDTRGSKPWPVVMVDTIAGPESAVVIAQSFSSFIEAIGVPFNETSR
ncbi:SMI1/KNR4 family protein [uncultured Dechloromonas sp.]|uniref:SMI1/KNR4 family protein n=1 Tax=uncultured Dechloromonas sp. TaxID=171719 RepID=UPI0025F4398F|nr:SMI1/KNR4 family protein [uncultured Dechloromonas sp.]